jgi:hypothetical protein
MVVDNSVSSGMMGTGCRCCEVPNLNWKEAGTQFGPNGEQALSRWVRPMKCFVIYTKAVWSLALIAGLLAALGATKQYLVD